MSNLNYNAFHCAEVTVTANGLTDDNITWVDLGDLTLSCNGREYKLDYIESGHELEDDGKTLNILIRFGSFDDAKECFEDCPFNLLKDDLKAHDLVTTIYCGTDDKDITDIQFVRGVIHGEPRLLGGVSEIKIDATDEKSLITHKRLYELLESYNYEVDEGYEYASMLLDFDHKDEAEAFMAKFKDEPLIYNDLAEDDMDITVNHYFEIHALLLLEESEVIALLNK